MSLYKSLFKQTLIYGLATVLPRMISFLLNPLYTKVLPKQEFADVSIVFAYLVFFNVVLSYGMETAFFRFYNQEENKKKVISTTTISIFWSTITFLVLSLLFRNSLSHWSDINVQYITYTIWILVLDALVIIPFSRLRAEKKPMVYAIIKIGNVTTNFLLNLFFLLVLPKITASNPTGFLSTIYFENFQVGYIFVSSLLSSLLTFIVLSPNYFKIKWKFDFLLWKKMIQYGFPILIAGIGFAINEHFDKILLDWFHVSKSDIGAYSACYKIGMFMVLFRTAFTLGIEPFFFSHAGNENAPQTYATITKYFVITGSFILLFVIVFVDILKILLVPNPSYWEAMKVVPLIILANFFLGIYTNLSVWYKIIDKTKIGAYISIIGAVITLLLNYLLIEKFSYYGSAIATITAYGSMMFISYYLGQKKYPIPYEINKIGSYLGISILLSGLSFYIPLFRESYIFGIFALILFGYYIYRNEKQVLLKILKKN
ncbi:Membrane protein involved in the export of O-antigen and teichoic acid [Flavobacterium swingsii]|uniref:Membrane protein involved in the export of O-antigen and teichoic acid n=1 Tax=Flavobacterium swingsii TaxID=498292 RepID=A0A1I0XA01_9FLAO|nr:polysaccharide biosynthesis C-terminal domain-containing protein [Flavobacterium swingsii]SFA97899.1 Membrane protein involved in the export of O-antigen and teichoic acid [Flavobacterium swingsii]